MTAAKSFDVPSPFVVKQEKDEEDLDDDDDDNESNYDDTISVSSLTQPSILDKDNFSFPDPSDEFLRLTSMVRRVYFSYLHKSVISNYNECCQRKDRDVPKSELKRFAGQMELYAVRASLEASLYRQNMLKMIADIKANTSRKKEHKKLTVFLETPPNRVDTAVQTCEEYPCKPLVESNSYTIKDAHIQSAFVTSNFCENSSPDPKKERTGLDKRISKILTVKQRLSPQRERPGKKSPNSTGQKIKKIKVKVEKQSDTQDQNVACTDVVESLSIKVDEPVSTEQVDSQIDHDMQDIFGDVMANPDPLRNEDENSRDSLMQHLEDMFCESDDSSDLMTLIEKHSGITKANLDSEIGMMCAAETLPPTKPVQQPAHACKTARQDIKKATVNSAENPTTKRKLSFSNYKEMKKRAMGETESSPGEETPEDREMRKTRGIWFVERVHQVSKLRTKMLELSVRNYRKHGRLRKKFVELFGDSDEEEMMPESPIHIEEHLTACKERIAPWVVKHLMPFYSKRVIEDRRLFKAVAKHIADMLIIEKTFPEEDDVGAYIKDYFRNKTSIKAESDIYI